MPAFLHRRLTLIGLTALAFLYACGDSGTSVEDPLEIEFSTDEVVFGIATEATVTLRNPGERAVGPIELSPSAVRDAGGASVPGAALLVSPSEISTLNGGESQSIRITLELNSTLQAGGYDAALTARANDGLQVVLALRFSVASTPGSGQADVEIASGPQTVRQGDVVGYVAVVRDADGNIVQGAQLDWSVEPAGAGMFGENGQFVGYSPGSAKIVARGGDMADTLAVSIQMRGLTGSLTLTGRGLEERRFTSDLWLHGDFAYSGSWGVRSTAEGSFPGNTLQAWSLSNPRAPQRTGTVVVDARTVNDIKIRADGTLGIMTHESSNDGKNGVTLLDLSDPGQPQAVGRFTSGLESGVHNVWIEGHYAYLVVDGTGSGLRVLDVSNPSSPSVVASFYGGSSFLHDVYVRDGLAILSHWDAGLIIVDVGNGMANGSPTNPVEVGRILTQGGQTHNAWYWPQAGYIFVGEEDNSTPGIMHVVDVRNMQAPVEVATFAVAGSTPHNFWLDESRGLLYMAWYERGVRVLDVSGELMGDLTRQAREVTSLEYDETGGGCTSGNRTCSWAPQLHNGLLYVADMHTGLVVLDPGSGRTGF